MADADRESWEIEWKSKPLGFSIIMDMQGKNAFVSSIQNSDNLEKGVTLQAQIIKVGDQAVEEMKHTDILKVIKSTRPPIRLTFASQKRESSAPLSFSFRGAPEVIAHRVDGHFQLVDKTINDHCVWQRKDEEEDKIIIWYWPADKHKQPDKNGLWVISRESHLEKGHLYAAVEDKDKDGKETFKYPTMVTGSWQIFDSSMGKYVACDLTVDQSGAD